MGQNRARSLTFFAIVFFGFSNLVTAPRSSAQSVFELHELLQHPERVFIPKLAVLEEVEDLGYGKMGNLDLTLEELEVGPQDPETDDGRRFDLGKIINIGKKLWGIIESNRPVINVTTDTASAMPAGAKDWTDLQQWSPPESKVFRAAYKNGFGSMVVDFSFRVMFTHGGNVKGVGRYLTNVTIVPANLNVAWGYRFSANGTVPSVINVGTHEAPIGGIQLVMQWSVDTTLKHMESSKEFFVRGDGGLFEIQ